MAEEDPNFGVEPYRFLVLVILCLNSTMCGMTCLQFMPIREEVMFFYDVDNGSINWTTLVFSVTNACLLFPSGWIFDKKGLRWALVGCGIWIVLGQIIKCFCMEPDRFYLLLVGQTVASIGQVFIFPSPSRLAADWFSAGEVSVASAVAVLANPVGIALSFLISPLATTDVQDKILLKKDLQNFQYGMTGATIAIFILTVIGIRDKPEFPPSVAAAYRRKEEFANSSSGSNYFISIKKFMKNKNLLLHLFSFGIIVSTLFNINSIFTEIASISFPGKLQEIGWMGFYYTMVGVVAAVCSGYYLDKTHRYKFIAVLMTAIAIFACILLTVMNRLMNDVHWLYIPATFIGISFTSFMSVGYELGTEITYPDSISTMSALLFTLVQTFAVVFLPIADKLSGFFPDYVDVFMMSFYTGLLLLAIILAAFVKPDYKRQAAETAVKTKLQSQDN